MELDLEKIEFQNRGMDLNSLETWAYCQFFYKIWAKCQNLQRYTGGKC